jgi:predicted nucleic acid-binding protein
LTLLDTNVLLRYASPADAAHATAKGAIASVQGSGETPCIFPQNVYEFWAAATRPVAVNGLGLSVPEAQTEVARLKRLFALLLDQPTLFAEWESLVTAHDCKGKVAHDARLVAAMRTHGVTRILTFNVADFSRFPGVVVLNPATVGSAPPTP